MPYEQRYEGKKQKKPDKVAQQAARQAQIAQDSAERNAKLQEERNKKAQSDADKTARKVAQKNQCIQNAVNNWNAKIRPIVKQVLDWRSELNNDSINAGNNPGGRNTDGGSSSALSLPLPDNDCGVTWGDAFKKLEGNDQSDSALFKVRRSGVLVHVKPG